MKIRRFSLASLALAVLAVGLQVTAMAHYSRGAQTIAQGANLPQKAQAALSVEARNYASRGQVIAGIGIAFAVTSVGFAVMSGRRHEPAWRPLTLVLLALYLMLQFVSV
jgi:hypothetical protein